ncbi:hypothetical protein CY35_01G036400 [Sphagnum magellanicum]|nr:hypothetical protein CY35_01G036400 [Sphagnum magellanicum]
MDFSTLQKSTNALDCWINSASQSLVSFVHQEMEAYRLYMVVPFLLKFVDNLTNVCVRFNHKHLKGRTGEDDSQIALSTLYYAVPNSDDSVHYCPFPEIEGQTDKCMEQSVLRMMTVIDLGCNIRECHSKPLKTPLREMVVVDPDVDFLDDITGKLGELSGKEIGQGHGGW